MIQHGKRRLSGGVTRESLSNYEARRFNHLRSSSAFVVPSSDPDSVVGSDMTATLNDGVSVTLSFNMGGPVREQHFEVTLHRATLAILLTDLIGD